MIIDVPLLRKELEYITANRVQWDQSTWISRGSCGTTACLAGNTVINAGYLPVYARHGLRTDLVTTNRDLVRAGPLHVLLQEFDDDQVESVRDVAQRLLGLDDAEANLLFDGGSNLYELWAIAAELTRGEIEIPASVSEEHEAFSVVPTGTDVRRRENARRLLQRERESYAEFVNKYRHGYRQA